MILIRRSRKNKEVKKSTPLKYSIDFIENNTFQLDFENNNDIKIEILEIEKNNTRKRTVRNFLQNTLSYRLFKKVAEGVFGTKTAVLGKATLGKAILGEEDRLEELDSTKRKYQICFDTDEYSIDFLEDGYRFYWRSEDFEDFRI